MSSNAITTIQTGALSENAGGAFVHNEAQVNSAYFAREAFEWVNQHQHEASLKGMGDLFAEYTVAGFDARMDALLGTERDTNPEIIAIKQKARLAMEIGRSVADTYLGIDSRKKLRKNGPRSADGNTHEEDLTWAAHGMRTAETLLHMGIFDPETLTSAYLHDLCSVLDGSCTDDALTEIIVSAQESVLRTQPTVSGDLSGEAFGEVLISDIVENIRVFDRTEGQIKGLAKVVQDSEISAVVLRGGVDGHSEKSMLTLKNFINHAAEFGFTPYSFDSYRATVISDFAADQTKTPIDLVTGSNTEVESSQRRYPTVTELMQVLAGADGSNNNALVRALCFMAQAADLQRYPKHTVQELEGLRESGDISGYVEARKSMLRNATDLMVMWVPMAQVLGVEPMISALTEAMSSSFFPEEYASMRQAIEELSGAYVHDETGEGIYFDAQLAALKEQSELMIREQYGDRVTIITKSEFDKRKIGFLAGRRDRILDNNEACIWVDKKTSGSAFVKRLNSIVKVRSRDIDFPRRGDGESQEAFAARSRAYWIDYITGAPDIIRGSIILADNLVDEMLFGEGQIPAGRERLEVDLDTRERNFQESWLGQLIRREFYLDELVPARPDMYKGQEYMFHRLVNWQWLAEAAKIVRRFTGTFFDEDQLHQFAEQYGAKGSSLNAFIPSREPDDGGYGAEAVELKKTGSDAPLADVIVASRGQEYGPNLRLHWIRQELRYLGGQLVLPWELHLYAEAVNTKVEFKDAPHGPFKLERWLSKEERNNEKLHWQRLRAWGTINLEMAELLYNGLLQKM